MVMNDDIRFTAQHHAMLFAFISKSVIEQTGEKCGATVIRDAVKKYGAQRGKRMALRAEKNGHPLTVENYLSYGEWEVPKGDMRFKFAQRSPNVRLTVLKCPWHDIWEREDLLNYGKYFCLEIDAALVNGFNPALGFEVRATRTNGGGSCDFFFKEANLTLPKVLGILYKKKIKPGKQVLMPWSYHTGHLFKVLVQTVTDKCQADSEKILEMAFKSFTGYFSQTHLNELKKYQETDFEVLP